MALGFASSMTGGILATKFGPKNFTKICQVSSIISLPFLLLAVMQCNSFYLSIFGAGMKYLLGEWYWSPNISMMQQSVPAGSFGKYISAYQFIITMAGCLATFTFGSIVNYLNCSFDKVLIGKIIAGFCTFGYLGSMAAWSMANKNFKKLVP